MSDDDEDDEFRHCWVIGLADNWNSEMTKKYPRRYCREPPVEDDELLSDLEQVLRRITQHTIHLSVAVVEIERVYKRWWTELGRTREAKRLMQICIWMPHTFFICVK